MESQIEKFNRRKQKTEALKNKGVSKMTEEKKNTLDEQIAEAKKAWESAGLAVEDFPKGNSEETLKEIREKIAKATEGKESSSAEKPAEKAVEQLQQAGFAAKVVGDGQSVVSQYPQAEQTMPRGSTVLLYTEEGQESLPTVVPAITGQTLEEARQTLLQAGLNLRTSGPAGQDGAVVIAQSLPQGQSTQQGDLVRAVFAVENLPEDADALADQTGD